jgi:hypothetical protein
MSRAFLSRSGAASAYMLLYRRQVAPSPRRGGNNLPSGFFMSHVPTLPPTCVEAVSSANAALLDAPNEEYLDELHSRVKRAVVRVLATMST